MTAAPTPADRVRIIEHRGKRIVYHDFTSITDTAEALAAIHCSPEMVRKEPAGTALTLTNVEGSRFNKVILDALKEIMVANRPHVKAAALTGLSGLQRVAYVAVSQLTGRRLPTFDTVEAAKDWLVSQA